MSLINNSRHVFGNLFIRFNQRKFLSSSSVSSTYVIEFQKLLGTNNVQIDDLEQYNQDWLHSHHGRSDIVLFPRNTDDVSNILKYCNTNRLKCVVQSGNTSLVAGSVPFDNEIIISMKKMNKILSFDPITGVLQCESGCILQHLEEFVQSKNRLIPYDLGAKGSCMIGGNLATNAGGLRFIRFGPLHANVLGLEVVLPNGNVLNLMSEMRKDNTGYHLRHLFIGSEGTLGIITKVSILCPMDYRFKKLLFISLKSYDDLLQLYQLLQEDFQENLTLFEMMDSESMNVVINNLKRTNPLSSTEDNRVKFYCLFELSTNDSNLNAFDDRITGLYEKLSTKSLIIDGISANEWNEMDKFLKLKQYREQITEALRLDGYCYKYDISLPLHCYYQIVDIMRKRFDENNIANYIRICGYGHMGDRNLHLNITSKVFDENILRLIEPFLYEYVSNNNGSISAEHGIGQRKCKYLHYSKCPQSIQLMKQLKQMFDPNLILNPYVLFDCDK